MMMMGLSMIFCPFWPGRLKSCPEPPSSYSLGGQENGIRICKLLILK